MATWRIEALGDAREVYLVDAPDEETARAMFERGDAGAPVVSEASTFLETITREA